MVRHRIDTRRFSSVLAFVAAMSAWPSAQSGVRFTTIARGAPPPSSTATFRGATQVGFDSAGNLYTFSSWIQKVAPDNTVTDVGDFTSASPFRFGLDPSGNSYFGDFQGTLWRVTAAGDQTQVLAPGSGIGAVKVDPGGVVYFTQGTSLWKIVSGAAVQVAGGGNVQIDGPIGTATIIGVQGIAFDAAGNIYLSANQTIRKVTPDGATTTIAGGFQMSGSADGVGTAARFSGPAGLAVDSAGNLFIADTGNRAIRRMATDGTVTTVAGVVGTTGSTDGPAAAATFSAPTDLTFDAAGALVIADGSIRVLSGGNVSTRLQAPSTWPTTSGIFADLTAPSGVAVGAAAWKYVADSATHSIRLISGWGASNPETVAAGQPGAAGSSDGTAAPTARFVSTADGIYDDAGTLYLLGRSRIRRIAADGTVTTLTSGLVSARALTRDGAGNFFVVDQCKVKKVTSAGVVTTFAGSDSCGFVDGAGTAAAFSFLLRDIAIDPSGTLYVGDGPTVRRIATDGTVTTLAGIGSATGSTDGTGSAARFRSVNAVAVGSGGTVYATDVEKIRAVTPGGVVTTLAGLAGTYGISDGDGASAHFLNVTAMAMGSDGLLYAMDGNRLRSITTAGHVTTIAGALPPGSSDGAGGAARFVLASQMCASPGGVLIVQINTRVRAASFGGVVTTVLKDTGASIDGKLTGDARFNGPGASPMARTVR